MSIHSEIDGTTGIAAYTPTAVNLGPGRTAKAVSGGNMHQCAILDDDTLKCRGYDGHGALGLGNRPNNRNTWVAVNLGDNYGRKAKAVTCGSQHTCAMLDDDTVKCWGTGQFGTLGYGDSLEYNPGNPIQDRDAPEPTAVVPYIPHPDFTVEILDAERRSTLVTSAPMTSADGYLAEFNRAGVESIDWRYIIDSDVHSDSSYAWSDFVDQSYDWSGIKDVPGVYFKDDPGVYFGLRSPPCPENNRVENGLCAPCTNGGTRAAGDDPDAGDTSCAFPDRTALKTAVDNCLAAVSSGVKCCSTGGANCGAAGLADMPDWDVSKVTSMQDMFHQQRIIQRGYIPMGHLQRHEHVPDVRQRQSVQPRYRNMEHLQRHEHVPDVPARPRVQPRSRCMGYLECHGSWSACSPSTTRSTKISVHGIPRASRSRRLRACSTTPTPGKLCTKGIL